MKAQLSLKDFENISAYLDGQLSPAETRRLEDQLKNDPERQAALEEMDSTRKLLRSAPRYRAPRNFILTAEMARQNTRRSFFAALPTFRFSAAMAALSLVAVFVLELSGFLSAGLPSSAALAPLAAPAMAPGKSALTQNDQSLSQPTLAFEWQSPQGGFGGGSGGGSSSDQSLTNAKPAFGMGGGPGESTSPLTGPVSLPPSAVQSLPGNTTQSTSPDTNRSLAASSQAGNPILGLRSQADGGKMISPNGELQNIPDAPAVQVPERAAAQTISQASPPWWSSRRYVEVGLLLLAVLAGVSAVYFRRKVS